MLLAQEILPGVKILDKYHKPEMVVLAPPTDVLECLVWSSHMCIDWNCGRVITTNDAKV